MIQNMEAIWDSHGRIRDIELLTGLEFLTANRTQLAVQKRTYTPVELWETKTQY